MASAVSRYGIEPLSNFPAPQSASLGPTKDSESVCYERVRASLGDLI